MAKKCQDCDDPAVEPLEGKWRCWKHHVEAKRKFNKNSVKIQFIKKSILFVGGAVGIIVGILYIIAFFSA